MQAGKVRRGNSPCTGEKANLSVGDIWNGAVLSPGGGREAVPREGPCGPTFAHLYDKGLGFKYL